MRKEEKSAHKMKYAEKYPHKEPFPRDEIRTVEKMKTRPDADLDPIPLLTKWKLSAVVKGKNKNKEHYSPHWELQSYKQKTDRFIAYNNAQLLLENRKRSKAEDE